MIVLDYLEDLKIKPPFEIVESVGSGADGQVFMIPGQDDRVLKLSVIHCSTSGLVTSEYQKVNQDYKYVIENPHKNLARVFEVKYLGSGQRAPSYHFYHYGLFYSVMEKLIEISKDEEKVLRAIFINFDFSDPKYSQNIIEKNILQLKDWLDFNLNKVMEFYEFLKNCPIVHNDISLSNIMKDAVGNFKLIDFDRITVRKTQNK